MLWMSRPKYRTVASLPLFHLVLSEVFVPSLTLRRRFKEKKKNLTPYYHGNNKISFPPEDLLNISILRIYSCVNEKGENDTSVPLCLADNHFLF